MKINAIIFKLNTVLTVILTLAFNNDVSAIKFRDANIIIRTCSYNRTIGHSDCFSNDHIVDYRPYIRLISGGIGQLLLDEIDDVIRLPPLKQQCAQSLSQLYKLLLKGDDAAFRLIDSSAKMPVASMEGTATGFGDYDECINIRKPHLTGQYCMVDVFVERPSLVKPSVFQLGKYHYFNETARYFGLCFPDTCSSQDVRTIVTHLLRSFPVRMHDDVDCVSYSSTSYLTRITNLT